MLKSLLPRPRVPKGFTLIEVMVATAVLVIAVSAMAALAAVMLTRGRQSRYMNVAATLASEKLEDLNRWSMNAQPVCVPSPDTSEGLLTGSLTSPAPVTKTIVCTNEPSETPTNINYYDEVSIDFMNPVGCGNGNSGCFAETNTSVTAGVTTYYTTYHSPNGTIPTNPDGSSNPNQSFTAPADMTFLRTWLIEANTPVQGTRRITVLVTLLDQSVKPGVSFQMSMVRQ
jgi:prepilin-type N-terminal cleavage/methylation domain-containing protein